MAVKKVGKAIFNKGVKLDKDGKVVSYWELYWSVDGDSKNVYFLPLTELANEINKRTEDNKFKIPSDYLPIYESANNSEEPTTICIGFISETDKNGKGDLVCNECGKEKFSYLYYESQCSECKKGKMELKTKIPFSNNPSIYCLYKGLIYKFDRVGYSKEEMLLQIMDLEDEERRKFERLKHKFSEAEKVDKEGHREVIPEEVRIAVWRRDEGKCVKCGSREKLEYDHIIPVSKGGSNTVRNIELLCEKCNREKKDNIG